MSRAELAPRLVDIDRLHASSLQDRPARLLQAYATALLSEDGEISPDQQAVFAAQLIDLATLTLGARRGAIETARRGGVKAARRRAIKDEIADHLGRLALLLDWVVRRHGLSAAYFRALFYDGGSSFTDYVLDQRLDHVRSLLGTANLGHHTIAALALMAGFSDISWFNQAFRRRFGLTPSDVRRGLGWGEIGERRGCADRLETRPLDVRHDVASVPESRSDLLAWL